MPEIQQIVDGLNCFTTKQHKCIGCPFHPGADKSRDFPYGCIRGQNEIVRAAQVLITELWHDVESTKSCMICKHWDECDPNGDDDKQAFFADCRGSLKLKWEWRGI